MPTLPKKTDDDEPEVAPTPALAAAPKAATRYKVLSGGLTGARGATYLHDAVVTADEIGDADRVQKLLERGSIEAV